MSGRRVVFALVVAWALVSVLSFGVGPGSRAAGLQAGPECTISASVSGATATFTGSITGLGSSPSWTLYFGDGGTKGGTGTSVSATHTYSQPGTYYPYLQASIIGAGGPITCRSNSVNIGRQLSVAVNETMGVSDAAFPLGPLVVKEPVTVSQAVGLVPPLVVNESVTGSDSVRPGPLPLQANETVGIGDAPSGSAPGAGDSARFTDIVSVVKGNPNGNVVNLPGGIFGLVAIGGGAAMALAFVVWKFVLPRRS